jgi:predicted CXXCH cytochrome family protein
VRVWLWAVLLLVAFAGVSFLAGVEVTDRLEQDDRFCIACHVPRMLQIYETSQPVQGRAVTLGGTHHIKGQVKCIDCHIGATIQDKVIIKAIAAKDTVKYFTGLFQDVEALTYPLGDRTCLKCHADGGQNALDPKAFHNAPYHRDPRNACSDCHRSHDEAPEEARFLQRDRIKPLCDSCHMEIMGIRR